MTKKNLAVKTIKKHIANANLYINEYLNYYSVDKMEDGVSRLENFFSDWFIRKCLWSTPSNVKTTAASIKKFYQCICEYNHIIYDDYSFVCNEIKESMEYWQEIAEDDFCF